MKRFLILFLISALLAVGAISNRQMGVLYAQAEWVNHRVSNTAFPANQYRTIAVDRHGNKWVGTENNGLLMFDNTNWESFTVANTAGGLTSNRINHITFDSHDNLWISTNGGGLVRKTPNNEWMSFRLGDVESLDPTDMVVFPSDEVNFVNQDNRGNYWIATNNGLVRIEFEGENFKMSVYRTVQFSRLLSNHITSIQFDPRNGDVMWIGTRGGLVSFNIFNIQNIQNDHMLTFTTNNSALTGNEITNLRIDNLGNKWMSVYNFTSNIGAGLFRLSPTNEEWQEFSTTTSNIPSNDIRCIEIEEILPNNTIWVATDSGIGRLVGAAWTTFNVASPQLQIPTNDIRSIIIERSNNTKWFGTSNNLLRNVGTTWANHPFLNAGIPNDHIQTMAFSGANSEIKWIGTANGLTRFDGSRWRVFNVTNSPLPSNDIRSLAVDRNNYLWVGTASFNSLAGGLARFDLGTFGTEDEEWEVYTVSSSNNILRINSISKVEVCQNNYVWIGTPGGGLYTIDRFGDWSLITQAHLDLQTDFIIDIFVDYDNNKWIATDDGISVLDTNNAFKRIYNRWNTNSGLLSNNIRRIRQDKDKFIWVVTDRGLAKLHEETNTWIVYNQSNTNNVLHETGITDINFDKNNIKWITTNRGLIRTNEVEWTRYDASNTELPSNLLNFIKIETVNNVCMKWIGSQNAGVIRYSGGNQLFPNDAYLNVFQHHLISNSLRISGIVNNYMVQKDIAGNDMVVFKINNTTVPHIKLANNTWFAEHTVLQNQSIRVSFSFTHAFGDIEVHRDLNVGLLNGSRSSISLEPDVDLELLKDMNRGHWLITESLTEEGKGFYRINHLREDFVNNLVIRTEKGNQIQWRALGSGVWGNVSTRPDGNGIIAFLNAAGDFRVLKESEMVEPMISGLSNFPNPFNPSTTIQFGIRNSEFGSVTVDVDIFDVRGRRVRTLYSGATVSDTHQFVWDGRDNSGHNVTSGIYFVRIKSNNESHMRKMLLLK